ncbi:4-oxalocrotonate tautomerase family protein [Streptomyces sp. NPDC058371]|uniref:tautomerase family protein n=1 Tax=Streptomyces sp. NPDC058371 TaxID=3346463 RepID=UPI00365157DB
MPYFRVTVPDPDLPADSRRALAEGLTGLAVSVLRKSAARTVVHINLVQAGSYYVGGKPLTSGRDAHVEASITLGTNSAAEKAAFIAGAGELLAEVLGPLPRAGVALHELHPESYGYNGATQFAFYHPAGHGHGDGGERGDGPTDPPAH